MTKPIEATTRVVMHNGRPHVESRWRTVGGGKSGPIPEGKILIMRLPLSPDATDDDMEQVLIDDDGSHEAFCPDCAAAGTHPDEVWQHDDAIWLGDKPKAGRNDPCPCGSGRKFKRCCLD